jgi:hypothetical protein
VSADAVSRARRWRRHRPALHAAAGEQHRIAVRVVIAAEELAAVRALFVHRRAAELAAPHDQRLLEQPARRRSMSSAASARSSCLRLLRELRHEVVARVRCRECPSRSRTAAQSARRVRPAAARAGSCWRATPPPRRRAVERVHLGRFARRDRPRRAPTICMRNASSYWRDARRRLGVAMARLVFTLRSVERAQRTRAARAVEARRSCR